MNSRLRQTFLPVNSKPRGKPCKKKIRKNPRCFTTVILAEFSHFNKKKEKNL